MVYLGYDGGGLGIMDLRSGESRVFNTSNSGIPGDNVLSISQDGDCLYLGIYTKGLVRFSLSINCQLDGIANTFPILLLYYGGKVIAL